MGTDDSFEDRLRAFADQVVKSLTGDVDDVAQTLGIDPDRAREVAGTLERWLNDRIPNSGAPNSDRQNDPATFPAPGGAGPHPLDIPTAPQGLALSGLDSGRLTVRAGTSVLATGESDPGHSIGEQADVVNELRARDWINPDGTLTIVGRQALLRWCRTADGLND